MKFAKIRFALAHKQRVAHITRRMIGQILRIEGGQFLGPTWFSWGGYS